MKDAAEIIEGLEYTWRYIKERPNQTAVPKARAMTNITEAIEEMNKRMPQEMEMEGGGSSWWYVCPECHGAIDSQDHFCRHCGQAVKA